MITEDDILNTYLDNSDTNIMYDELFQLIDLAKEQEEEQMMTKIALNIENNNFKNENNTINIADDLKDNLNAKRYYDDLHQIYDEIDFICANNDQAELNNYTSYFSKKAKFDNDNIPSNQEYFNQQGGSLYQIINQKNKTNKKFNCTDTITELNYNLTSGKTFLDIINEIQQLFQNIYDDFISPLHNNDLVRLIIYHDLFNDVLAVPFMEKSQITVSHIQNAFEHVVQSFKKIPDHLIQDNHKFKISLVVAKLPYGGHKHKLIPGQKKKLK